jgi:hypothetical protein
MAENKTQPTTASVDDFLAAVADDTRREECRTVCALMRDVTGAEPVLWGPSIVGFGRAAYRYESGREGEWFAAGFSPRKASLTLYLSGGLDGLSDLLPKLGRHTTGKSCLYLKTLAGIDLGVLREMVVRSVANFPPK